VRTESGDAGLIAFERVKRVPRAFWGVTLVRDLMDRAPRSLRFDEPISRAVAEELVTSPLGAMPVTDGFRVVGYVRYGDVAEVLRMPRAPGRLRKRTGPGDEAEAA
jgi:hypothetical protein